MAVSWVRSWPAQAAGMFWCCRVGPEVRVHDVQVDLHPGRAHLPGQREVAGQVAVAGRRVDPQPHPDVVRARLARDRHRGARPAVVAERGAGRELLRGERQVGAEVQPGRGGVGPVRPELAHAHVGPGVAVDGQLGVPGLGARRQREVHRVTRVERDVAQGRHLLPGPGGAGQLDRGRGRRAGGVQREAQVGQRPDLAEVDGQRPGIARRAPVGARVAVDRVRRGLAGFRRGRGGRAGQGPVHGGRRTPIAGVCARSAGRRAPLAMLPPGRAWAAGPAAARSRAAPPAGARRHRPTGPRAAAAGRRKPPGPRAGPAATGWRGGKHGGRGQQPSPFGRLDLWVVPSGSPSNRRMFGLKWTASRVFGQAEIDCLMGFHKEIIFPNVRGASPGSPAGPGPGEPRSALAGCPQPARLGGAPGTQERARWRPGYPRACSVAPRVPVGCDCRQAMRRRSHHPRSLDDFLICIGYEGCYGLVIIVTAVSVNPPRDFLPKSCAYRGSFWHCCPPAVLARGGPGGAPGQVQRVGSAP